MKVQLTNQGKVRARTSAARQVARYEAAVWLERARQIVRECQRYGYPVTLTDVNEVHDAEKAYNAATAAASA